MFARALSALFVSLVVVLLAVVLHGVSAMAAEATNEDTQDVLKTSEDTARRIGALRDEAETLRAEAETVYQRTEAGCYQRFMVNHCINKAKAERLATIRRARELEAEARRLDLAERQRVAARIVNKAAENGAAPLVPTPPSPDIVITPRQSAPARTGSRTSAGSRAAAEARAKAREEAARRAETARRDRERYEARIREYEEKRARDAAGR
ncbi:MAG: hypothetical protein LBB76_00225 [Azoarcus sp.]|nr:hypothetical protein [Azoarcus sp.]